MKKKLLLKAGLLLFSLTANAQIEIDLADSKTSTETISSDCKSLLIITNFLPDDSKHEYTVNINMREEKIPALSPELGLLKNGVDSLTAKCDPNYYKAFIALKNAAKESDVSPLINALKSEIKKLNAKKSKSCIDDGNSLIKKTVYTKPLLFKIAPNQTIVITITRISGKDTVEWKRTFKTTTQSPWSILYGFTFIPNMMNPVSNYYTKADTSGTLFTITEMNNQGLYFFKNISPTLMFTWKPINKYRFRKGEAIKALFSNNFYQLGFVAGLSMNFSSDAGSVNVLAAPAIVIADNISLSAGVALTQKNILKGEYKAGDVLKEKLDFDQLHEKKYMAEWFVSLSFRFDKNPFKKDD